jgi:hypothetical protein
MNEGNFRNAYTTLYDFVFGMRSVLPGLDRVGNADYFGASLQPRPNFHRHLDMGYGFARMQNRVSPNESQSFMVNVCATRILTCAPGEGGLGGTAA